MLCGPSLAMDADLRFALEHRLESDIIKRCLVYIHKVINAEGQGPKTANKLRTYGTEVI